MMTMPDRLRPVPISLANEAQVFTALEALVQQSAPANAVATLARSGLLAVSIPADFGGADISNAVVAETVSRVCAWNAATAMVLAQHLVALELLRVSGTTEQRRTIYSRVVLGEVFGLLEHASGQSSPHIRRSGLSYTFQSPIPELEDQNADWHVLAAKTPEGEVAAILGKDAAALLARDQTQAISPDNVLELGPFALPLATLMQAFLQAAICRGARNLETEPDSLVTAEGVALAIELELLDAMIFKAATVIDAVQVEQSTFDPSKTDRLCAALKHVAQKCSSVSR